MGKRYFKNDAVNMTEADVEYSYAFGINTKELFLQSRTGKPFKYAFNPGDIALDKYITAHQGMAKIGDGLSFDASTTIYFSCSTSGEVMEVEFIL